MTHNTQVIFQFFKDFSYWFKFYQVRAPTNQGQFFLPVLLVPKFLIRTGSKVPKNGSTQIIYQKYNFESKIEKKREKHEI